MEADRFGDMTLEELRAFRKNVDRAISSYEARARQSAIEAIEEAAKHHGFKLSDLIKGHRHKRAGIQYSNPENQAETWSGRGRRPRWVSAALDAGRSLEDLAVKDK